MAQLRCPPGEPLLFMARSGPGLGPIAILSGQGGNSPFPLRGQL
ncbi:hypothetical protein Lokhon_01446 [Limimaricola hongkongensis DSM 17492]|uniref:Uncharacterized protein n=1 Tax=Limimaricola hongkongensis DSM 17492 TaxID=1122180 RepID=A0A017HEB7_9RHOB|nr:hypothetical protein Lokhon_01446 [Limimaricola hongkongensis DSM 17492]